MTSGRKQKRRAGIAALHGKDLTPEEAIRTMSKHTTTTKQAARAQMMKQYREVKEKYPEHVLLFQAGEYYETFDTDAVIAAEVCDLVLTAAAIEGEQGKIPNTGIPYKDANKHIAELVQAGHRVATADRIKTPAA